MQRKSKKIKKQISKFTTPLPPKHTHTPPIKKTKQNYSYFCYVRQGLFEKKREKYTAFALLHTRLIDFVHAVDDALYSST